MTKLILGAFLATSFLFYGYSTHKCDSNVQLVANLANYFKVAQFCDHKYNLVVSVDSTYNRWDLRYTTTVEESENIGNSHLDLLIEIEIEKISPP